MASPLCALALCFAAGAYVHDGDGIWRGPDRVRLLGIQAPEIDAPGGIASRDHLRALIGLPPLRAGDRNHGVSDD